MTEQDAMEIWQKISTPGAEHVLLERFTGEFNTQLIVWMVSGQPPMESSGSARFAMILGGRVHTEEFKSEMGGMSFEGWGTMGFDNYKRKFWMTWNDNMFTGIIHLEGDLSADGKTIILKGKIDKAMQNLKDVPLTAAYHIENDDRVVFKIWEHAGTPQEYQSLEIRYTR